MKNTDPRLDGYIKKSAAFAQPILKHLRKLVHQGCPGVLETIKWGFPHFEHHGILCSMAAFKMHCTFGFWRAELLSGVNEKANSNGKKGMGQFGRVSTLKDLPSDTQILRWVKEAAKLNEQGIPVRSKKKITRKKILKIPTYITKTLNTNKKAADNFKLLTPAQRNEYVEWIIEAKTETTRTRRQNTMMEWVIEGKSMNWKYLEKYK